MKKSIVLSIFILMLSTMVAKTQEVRMETFIGTEAPETDVFWVKPFTQGSSFLFLSRNTFRIPEYDNELGNFSTLSIAAYQFKKTGFGIALAVTATSTAPFQARSGIQFLKVKPEKFLLYSIISTKLGENADARWLTIAQFTPKITAKLQLFTRAEWVTSVGFSDTHRFSASIARLGFQLNKWQFGVGANNLWLGERFASTSGNYGIFVTKLF